MFSIEVGVGKCVGAGGVAHGKLGVVDELVAVRGEEAGLLDVVAPKKRTEMRRASSMGTMRALPRARAERARIKRGASASSFYWMVNSGRVTISPPF